MANIGIGIKKESFLTIIDEDEDDTFVNVVINIQERYGFLHIAKAPELTVVSTFASDETPIRATFTETPQIPRKVKRAKAIEANGNDRLNGEHVLDADTEAEPKGLKRLHIEDGDQPLKKKAKVSETASDDVVVVEDASGAIVIDD